MSIEMPPRIGALQGAVTSEIQSLLTSFAARRRDEGLHIAGVVEIVSSSPENTTCGLELIEVATGSRFQITQSLGSGSTACRLDTQEMANACAAVLRAIEAGVDVVLISKFGKLEASGGGLLDCFRAAAEAGIPCITGVAPALAAPFLDFAGEYAQWIEANQDAVENWWHRICARPYEAQSLLPMRAAG
jgi:nucleoside-triphosphatase THEP1